MPRYSYTNNTNLTLEYCLNELQKIMPDMNKSNFAKLINATKQNVGQRLKKGSKLTVKELEQMSETLHEYDVPTKFLDSAILPLDKTVVQIPIREDVELSCGSGAIPNAELAKDTLAFDKSYLKKLGGNPESVSIVYARGDSMADKIESGDALIVDESKKQIVDGCIYAFLYNSELYCKQIQKLPTGMRAISLNKDYEPFSIEQDYDFNIIGKVISAIKTIH